MALAAGKLDRRIALERFTSALDAYNEPVKTWVLVASVAASFEPVTDGEQIRAGELSAMASARFQIRHSSTVAGLNPKDRLTFEGVVYDILRVKEIGRRVGLEITAVARADG